LIEAFDLIQKILKVKDLGGLRDTVVGFPEVMVTLWLTCFTYAIDKFRQRHSFVDTMLCEWVVV